MEIDKKFQILLSTYNGEKYLREQLDSLCALDNFSSCRVLIRDDGSSDKTCEILKEYQRLESFDIFFGDNIGITRSYQWLLKHSDSKCSYFAFSDQDDVWLSDKLIKAEKRLDSYSENVIALFASRSRITDEFLQPLGETIFPKRGIGFYNALIQNVLPGHTQVFNRKLRQKLIDEDFAQAECIDWWVYLLASALGEITFEPSCTVLHRQHHNNAVGYSSSPFFDVKKRLRYIKEGKGNKISCQIKAFYRAFREELPDEYRSEIESYLGGLANFVTRQHYLSRTRIYRQNRQEDWKFRILYLLGKYALPNLEDTADGKYSG